MQLSARIRSYALCLWLIPVMVSVTSVFADRTLIDIVVAQHVKSELQPRLDRLATDLRNDGYTARITSWPAGKSGRDVWNHLKDGYDNDNLLGALLVGHVPTTKEGNGKNTTDIPYWCMSSYSSMSPKHIWVSRFYGPITSDFYAQPKYDYGDELRFLENALDANHEYRTGKTRLPHKAFAHTCIRREGQNEACRGHQAGVTWATNAREFWPESQALYADELDQAMFEWGGDLLDEHSHGNYVGYAEWNITSEKVFQHGCRIRTILATSCTVGGFGSVVNIQNVCDNTYNIISVGASAYDYGAYGSKLGWDHAILDNDGSAFRRQLKAGKPWGSAMLSAYPFENDEKTLMYGDLSLKPMMFPPGEPTPEYTISVIVKPGGVITPLRPVRVLRGNDETFTIKPAELLFIDDVLVDGKSVGAVARYTFENVQSDRTIEAVFASTSATIVSDDFESGNVSGGAGSWTQDWSPSSLTVPGDNPHGGRHSLRLRGEDKGEWYARREFAVVGSYTMPVTLEFWYYGHGFAESDKLRIIFNSQGDKHTIDEVAGTNDEYRHLQFDLTPWWKQGSEKANEIWFMLPYGSNAVVHLDDIRIYGAGGDSNEPPGRASNPGPKDNAVDVEAAATLNWSPGSGATSHTVYFGIDDTPDADEKQSAQAATVFDPGPLEKATTYYWRIDEVNEHGTTTGEVWSFTTADDAVGVTALSAKHTAPRISHKRGTIMLQTGMHTGSPAVVTIVDPRGRTVLRRRFEQIASGNTIPLPTNAHGASIVTVRLDGLHLRKKILFVE